MHGGVLLRECPGLQVVADHWLHSEGLLSWFEKVCSCIFGSLEKITTTIYRTTPQVEVGWAGAPVLKGLHLLPSCSGTSFVSLSPYPPPPSLGTTPFPHRQRCKLFCKSPTQLKSPISSSGSIFSPATLYHCHSHHHISTINELDLPKRIVDLTEPWRELALDLQLV